MATPPPKPTAGEPAGCCATPQVVGPGSVPPYDSSYTEDGALWLNGNGVSLELIGPQLYPLTNKIVQTALVAAGGVGFRGLQSLDKGINWSYLNRVAGPAGYQGIQPFAITPDGDVLGAFTSNSGIPYAPELFISSDDGLSFASTGAYATPPEVTSIDNNIGALNQPITSLNSDFFTLGSGSDSGEPGLYTRKIIVWKGTAVSWVSPSFYGGSLSIGGITADRSTGYLYIMFTATSAAIPALRSYLFRSTDGGATFTEITGAAIGAPFAPPLLSGHDGNLIMGGGSASKITVTQNGGSSWSWVDRPFNGVDRPFLGAGYLCKHPSLGWYWKHAIGQVWNSVDGGLTWNLQTVPGASGLGGIITTVPRLVPY